MSALTSVWAIVFLRMAIGLIAGEIAIRYTSWWLTLYSSEQKFAASSAILGIAMCATALCGIELQYMLIRTLPDNVTHEDITQGFYLIFLFRVMLLVGFMFLSYPVNVIVYRHSWRKVLTEILVRVFLIAASFIAGLECAELYHCHLMGAC